MNLTKYYQTKYKFLLFGFTIGILLTSAFWGSQNYNIKNELKYEKETQKSLTEQIQLLRTDFTNLSDQKKSEPTPIPFISTKKYSFYEIECFEKDKINQLNFDWLPSLKQKLTSNDELIHLCFNKELNQTALITSRPENKTMTMGPTPYSFQVSIYNINANNIDNVNTSSGNYLGGSCGQIKNWAMPGFGSINSLLVSCEGGDGVWASKKTIVINIPNKKVDGIAEACSYFTNESYCKKYCETTNDCSSNSFCDLESNSCIQKCSTKGNYCPSGGLCKAFGPVLGCS